MKSAFAVPLLCASWLLGCGPSASEMERDIFQSAKKGDSARVRALLQKKRQLADARYVLAFKRTPLHVAANRATAEALIEAGADIRATDQQGQTPLDTAVCGEVAELLIARGADPKAHLALRAHFSSSPGDAEVLRVLLKAGADPLIFDPKSGLAAIHQAAQLCATASVRELLDFGVPVDSPERDLGTSALFWAIAADCPETAKLLLSKGADPRARPAGNVVVRNTFAGKTMNISSAEGVTPLSFVKSRAMCQALAESGVQPPASGPCRAP